MAILSAAAAVAAGVRCITARADSSSSSGGDSAGAEAAPLLRSTRVVLPRGKALKWSTGVAPGEYGGPPTTTKLRKYWGGRGDEDPVTATDDFIWNKEFLSRMRRLLGDEPPNPNPPPFAGEHQAQRIKTSQRSILIKLRSCWNSLRVQQSLKWTWLQVLANHSTILDTEVSIMLREGHWVTSSPTEGHRVVEKGVGATSATTKPSRARVGATCTNSVPDGNQGEHAVTLIRGSVPSKLWSKLRRPEATAAGGDEARSH